MNNISKFFSSIILGLITLVILNGCEKKDQEQEKMQKEPAIKKENMDLSIKPGDDFFNYANGTWRKNNPIPEEESRWGAFNELMDRNLDQLREMMESAADAKNPEAGSTKQKIGDFYASGMDKEKIEAQGFDPIKLYLTEIGTIETKDDLMKLISKMHSMGMSPLFHVFPGQDEKNSEWVIMQLYQGGLGLPDRQYYLSDDNQYKEIRKKYKDHIANMFGLIGYDAGKAAKTAEIVMNLEKQIAEISWERVDLRNPQKNYNRMKAEELAQKAGNMDWKFYMTTIGINDTNFINVGQPSFFEGINGLLDEIAINDWKKYLEWNLLGEAAPYLAKEFSEERFNFYGKVLSGQDKQKPRWKRVLMTTSGSLGELVGQLYVEKHFPPEAKERMLDLVENLRIAFRDHIEKVDWMTDETKEKALVKLNKMNSKIGYPDKWRDYSELEIGRDSYFDNVIASAKFNFDFQMNKIGKPVDRGEWHMYPQTVNAYYSPTMNEIVFPAAILQPPFFFLNADDAVNYGAIGAVIGHEMTHGFDDQGRQYDVSGNLLDWWTEADAKQFDAKAKVLVDQYNQYEPLDSMNINGKLTLGENIADLGGVTISYTALQKAIEDKEVDEIDGFTPEQRFFLSYAQVWRQNIRDQELMKRLKTDVHSPAEYRVNGIVKNLPFFYEAFSVAQTGQLWLPEEERAKIW